MAEATMDTQSGDEIAALKEAARAFDFARMRKLGSFHFAMVMGALTMWGAAEAWAQATGWEIARFAAVANALVAGFIIPSAIHEWGHLAGARLSGAVSPVLDDPPGHFVVFDYQMDKNASWQFSWMSWGGILAPWLAVLLALIFVPLDLTSGAVLFSTLVFKAVSAAAFEVPITLEAAKSGEPGRALSKSVKSGGLSRGRKIGAIVGLASFVLIWLAG